MSQREAEQDILTSTIREGYLLDYISQEEKKETPKELVRQRVARALVHELHINPDDMEMDLTVRIRGRLTRRGVASYSDNVPFLPDIANAYAQTRTSFPNATRGTCRWSIRSHVLQHVGHACGVVGLVAAG